MKSVVKKVVLIRHDEKSGESIKPENLVAIETNGIKGLNGFLKPENNIVIGLGTELKRTEQTILAFQAYMEKQGCFPSQILAAEKRFGSSELFNSLTGNADLMAEKAKVGWYMALCYAEPKLLDEIQVSQLQALSAIFETIDDAIAIIVGHTPMIELLAIYIDSHDVVFRGSGFGIEESLSLNPLQGVEFSMDDRGNIHVSGLIGF
jgi:hypothetical protein